MSGSLTFNQRNEVERARLRSSTFPNWTRWRRRARRCSARCVA